MDSCILKQCRVELLSQIRTPPRIIETARRSHSCLELTLEWPGEGERRVLILDVDQEHPTAHLARPGRRASKPGTRFAERTLGLRITAIRTDTEPRIWRVDLSDCQDAIQWSLIAAWTGRLGNIRLVDPSGHIVEALLPGGPRPGALYSPPPGDPRVPAGEALQPLAKTIVGMQAECRHDAVRKLVRDVDLPAALDAVLTACEHNPDLAAVVLDPLQAERAAFEILRSLRLPDCATGGSSTPRLAPQNGDAAVESSCSAEASDRVPDGISPCAEHHLYLFTRGEALELPRLSTDSLPVAWMSGVRLPSLERFRSTEDRPLRDMLERAYDLQLGHAGRERERSDILFIIRREAARLRRLHAALVRERLALDEGTRLRRSGEAILASIHAVRKGETELICPDWRDPAGIAKLKVALDPAKTPAENAKEYFRRARRWERGEPHRKKRLAAIDQASSRLSELETRIAGAVHLPSRVKLAGETELALGFLISPRVREILRSLAESPTEHARPAGRGTSKRTSPGGSTQGGKALRSSGQSESRFRPRSFRTRDGWTVLVGRSNEENDYLSHRLAHPEDIWLHAHGVPGSHVVLRREGRKDNPSAKTLEEAAAIAAFFSKARHSRKVSVLYTLKKYVRKPRKAKPGLAVCTREKTIMVAPKDPTEGKAPEWMEE